MVETAHKELLGPRMRERIAMLSREHGNINSASEYAAAEGQNSQAALQIAGLLTVYFKAHGEAPFAIRLCERALTQMCHGINVFFGSKIAADVPLLEAVSIAREVGDEWAEAYSSGHLALWLTHLGRLPQAAEHLETIERLANAREDSLLRGLAGLARGWLLLAEGNTEHAIQVLRAVRDLGPDPHQHHFIDMYIGLAFFSRGEFAAASMAWYDALRSAMDVGHLRGIAGSVEGCAYIAAQLGNPQEACRFLGAAEELRQRAASPLFNFWFAHNQTARETLRSTLGARMRAEDVVNDAATRLRHFAQA